MTGNRRWSVPGPVHARFAQQRVRPDIAAEPVDGKREPSTSVAAGVGSSVGVATDGPTHDHNPAQGALK